MRIKETAAVKNTGHANYVVKTMKNRLLHYIQIMETDITVRVYAVTFIAMYFLWIRIKHKKITDCAANVKRGNDMVNGIIMTVLTIESISDIKTKSMSCVRLTIYFLMALFGNLIFGYQSVMSMAGGIAIGIIVLVYGLITKEGIGYGDGIMFMCLGTVLGASQNLRLLFLSLICATAAGCIYALVLKKGMKTEIPFIPCILCSYIFMTALRVFV